MFRPYQHRILQPRSGGSGGGVVNSPERAVQNVLLPVATTIDLLTIPVSGTKDFFLWQPYQNSLQDAFLGADENNVTTPEAVTVQLVQINGSEERILTQPERFSTFSIEPVKLAIAAQVLDGPVFLRVTTQPTDRLLFATMHVLTPEIP